MSQIININRIKLPLMPSYEEQSTNFMTNPFNPNSSLLKQKLLEEPTRIIEDDNSKTVPFPIVTQGPNEDTIKPGKLPKKIKPPINSKATQLPECLDSNLPEKKLSISGKNIDQEDTATKTRKVAKSKKIICEGEQQKHVLSIVKQRPSESKINFISKPESKKLSESAKLTATILTKPSLRQKFNHLLPPAHQRPISSGQQHLITLMGMIDEAIHYTINNRNYKIMFFQDLKKIMRDSCKVFVEHSHLEQLLYLDEGLYNVRWERRLDNNIYDISMKLPEIKSKEARKNKVRETIVEYLSLKQEEFLKAKNITNFTSVSAWHDDFLPRNYEIPRKALPPHPETRAAELRCLDDSKINAIKNDKVRQLFKTQKQKAQTPSFMKEKSSMQLIFAGTSASVLQERLMAAVREKEEQAKKKRAEEQKWLQRQKTQIMPDTLKQIAQVLLKTYTSRNVSNIFKVKVLEILKQRTNNKYGEFAVSRHLEYLIQQKSIGYLKEVVSRDKTVIVQISTGKYKDVLAHVKEMKEKQKATQAII